MKKFIAIAFVGAALVLTSCKKDYVCKCTTTGAGTTLTSETTITATKKDAEAACNATSTVGTITTTCEIQ